MAEGSFQVVFRGEAIGDQPLASVKQQIGELFRMPADRVEALFSGKPVVVKKNVDEATARKLEQAFRRAGAVCEVRDTSAGAADRGTGGEAPAQPAPESADTGGQTGGDRTGGGGGTRGSGSIAAAGDPHGTILDLAIPESYEGLEVDTSEAPLASGEAPPPPEIDTSGLDLAAPDSGNLSEREPPPPADIDTSGLQMESLEDER